MKSITLKLLTAALITLGASLPGTSQAQSNWPQCYQNAYINNTQQYVLVRADCVQAVGGLTYGKGVTVGGRMKYFIRSDGQTNPSKGQGGPTYYVCLFSDVPLVKQQQVNQTGVTAARNAASAAGGPFYNCRFVPKGSQWHQSIPGPNDQFRTYNAHTRKQVIAQLEAQGYQWVAEWSAKN